jgi:hypothetical protein
MIRVSSIPPSPENKRNQIRKNILEGTYSKKVNIAFQTFENPRLQFRFAEALDEADEKCYVSGTSEECFAAWQEVDELEDSLMRLGVEVFQNYSMRYGSLLRRTFKLRWNVRNVEDHHVIPKEFKSHPIIEKINYDIHASENIIMMHKIYHGIDIFTNHTRDRQWLQWGTVSKRIYVFPNYYVRLYYCVYGRCVNSVEGLYSKHAPLAQ